MTIALNAHAQSNRSHNQATSRSTCFTPPDIPMMLRTEKDKYDFLAMNWWDNFAFQNEYCISKSKDAERAFIDFIRICSSVDKELSKKAIHKLMNKTKLNAQSYAFFYGLAEKYYYHPNSPMRNEEAFAIYLEYVLADNTFSSTERIRPKMHLEDINKNRLGSIASDFSYITSEGKKGRLHQLKTNYILVYFNNPDCDDCKRALRQLKQSKAINQLLQEGKLSLLSLYVDDDIALWKNHQHKTPDNWINARDDSSDLKIQNQLYILRAIPSIYLLDKNKKVLLKDGDVKDAEEAIVDGLEV